MRLHKKIANLLGYELLRVKTKQPTVESHLAVLFEKAGINCVIDVGANIGQYGTLLRKNGYEGKIISFEPVTSSFEILKERSRSDNNWSVYKQALGSREESKSINITHASHFSSFYTPNSYSQKKFSRDTELQNSETVEISKLDTLFHQLVADIKNPKIFLKLDTQGFDLEVFKGAEGCIERIIGLQSEISMIPIYEGMPGYIESLTLFEKKGFKITGLYPVSREKDTLKLIELDCIMRKNI